MRLDYYLKVSVALIDRFNGSVPFSIYLKDYFNKERKHGSKDRKYIIHFCYGYFRLGNSVNHINTELAVKIATFLMSNEFEISWDEFADFDYSELRNDKISFISNKYPSFSSKEIFKWQELLSEGVDHQEFNYSHLIQPDLFLRIRLRHLNSVIIKLREGKISFVQISNTCISVDNKTKIDLILRIDEEVVIQDRSSQQIGDFFPDFKTNTKKNISVWDCCAASGGKSILAYDLIPNIYLTVSDIRSSILINLKKRFLKAGIHHYDSFVSDISINNVSIKKKFDFIICDVPCTGSGTWARNPENLKHFNPSKINDFALLQKKIVANVLSKLLPNGYLLYVTCSVFKQENEDVVEYLLKTTPLILIKKQLIAGYTQKADSMFVALFRNLEN